MKKSTGVLLVLYAITTISWNLFLMDRLIYKNFLRGYTNIGAYPIIALIVLILAYILSAALPKITRYLSFPITLIIFVLTAYLSIFYVNWNSKPRFNQYDKFISAQAVLFSSIVGVFFALLFNKKEISMKISMTIAFVLYAI